MTKSKYRNFISVPNKLLTSTELSVYEKLVFLNLMCYEFEDENDIPMRQLAEDLGISRAYVHMSIKKLIEKNLLKKEMGIIPNGGKICNIYTLYSSKLEDILNLNHERSLLSTLWGF